MKHVFEAFVAGMFVGAGLLAFFQNRFDYRIDQEVEEYDGVVVAFFKKLFAKTVGIFYKAKADVKAVEKKF